jgi:CubicO group peptidase (beta-lactamase class C family)
MLRHPVHRFLALALAAGLVAATAGPAHAAQTYFPPPGDAWESRPPEAVGADPVRLAEAVAFARANEIGWLKDMRLQLERNTAQEPFPWIQGAFKNWDSTSGLVVRHGYIIAEWGDTRRIDMSFSVAKSYLSTVAGLAFDRGLLPDVHQPVRVLVRDGGFDSEHNARITWHMLLNQTSEWEGTLWNKPDVADRRRGRDRTLQEPGSFWEYNDVRVNRLSLALLRLWQRPLPEVLAEYIMDPIGASNTWRWLGYHDSWVDLGGRHIESVSGGSHWGGGFWASTRDHARFGLLMLHRGRWGERQLLSEQWIAMATTPTPIRPVYGYLWWLNTDRQQYPNASTQAVFALGAGGNVIWIEPALDLVVVVRWMNPARFNEFAGKVVTAFGGP